MAAAASLLNAAKGVSAKALHIRIYPKPADLAESREILKVLRSYGEIFTYRSLKHEYTNASPSTSLAIFRETEAAERLMGDSPLKFSLEPVEPEPSQEQSNPYLDLFNRLEAEHQSGKTTIPTETPFRPGLADPTNAVRHLSAEDVPDEAEDAPASQPDEHQRHAKPVRHFLVHAKPWTSNIEEILDRAHYTGSFVLDTKSPSQQDLAKRVPSPGLSMIELGREPIPARIAEKRNAALRKRKTLRQLMQEKEQEEELELDVTGLHDQVTDGEGGYVSRRELQRRATGITIGRREDGRNPPNPTSGNDQFLEMLSGEDAQQVPVHGEDRVRAVAGKRRRNPGPWTRKYDRMI